jgi:hypothetical protein
MSEAAAGGPTTTTSPAVGESQTAATTISVAISDDALKEPEVIMGHLDLGAPGQVFDPEALDTTLFALQQAWDMIPQEQKNIEDERARLLTWAPC